MREFLKGLDLDSELIDTIMAEHGKIITGLKEQNSSLKEENKTLKNENEELKKVDVEQIKKEQFDLGKAEGSQEVETFKKSIALKEALKNTKVKDADLLLKLISDDKINYEEKDGKYEVSGLDEQISEIKKTHEYLFEAEKSEEKPPQRINVGDTHTTTPTNQPTTLVGALKEAYNKK
jgi:FtsZ-binding cell division protein ZapB